MSKKHVLQDFIHKLEMAIAMMKRILLHAITIVVTVAAMSMVTTVLNVFVIFKNHVLLTFIHQLEMDSAMMKLISLPANMMVETAVEMLIQLIAQNAIGFVRGVVMDPVIQVIGRLTQYGERIINEVAKTSMRPSQCKRFKVYFS